MHSKPRFTLPDICQLLQFAVSEVPGSHGASLVIDMGEDQSPMVLPLPTTRPQGHPVSADETLCDC